MFAKMAAKFKFTMATKKHYAKEMAKSEITNQIG